MNTKKIGNYKKIISFLLGSLLVLALPPYYIFIIPLISVSGLLLLLNQSQTKKQSFAIGYWFGFGFFAFGFSWIGNALLIDALMFGWLYPIVLIASGAFFGLFSAFPALCTFYFKGITSKALAFASFYTLFEWLRSFILTGFPWNQIGSMLAFDIHALQLASVLGTFGLTLLILIISAFPAIFYKTKNKSAIIAPLVLIAIVWGFGYYRLNKLPAYEPSETIIRIVQPSIPQTMKWDRESLESNFNQYIELSKSEPLNNVDLVIWGETAVPFQLDMQPEYLEQLASAIPPHGSLATGLVRVEFDPFGNIMPLNSMFVIDSTPKIVDHYDKVHLVPFGEYIPLREYLPNWVRPVANSISNFKKGEGHKVFKTNNIPSFGALICYEIIFPAEIVDKNSRPEWIINLTNDGWYGDSAGPRQHLVATQLRAVEQGLTIVRAANSGISAMISTTGSIIDKIELNETKIKDIPLPKITSTPTTYSAFGNITILILCLANILLAYLFGKKTRNKAYPKY